MAHIDARFGLGSARRLQATHRRIGVALGHGVADVDLAAGDVEVAPVRR
jgi:hypothetical protein